MKNLLTLTALSVVLFASCGDHKKITDLEHQNDSLRNELKLFKPELNLSAKVLVDLKKIDSSDLVKGVKNFQELEGLKIPSAWEFEANKISLMLGPNQQGKTITGLMAYPMNENGYLKIALVPYYDDNEKKMHFSTNKDLNAYNFSDMVPSIDFQVDHSVFNDSLYGVKNYFYEFRKHKGSGE